MPYKDPEAKRRYMARYYQQKIKTGEIPCTVHRKRSYGLTNSYANKTQIVTPLSSAGTYPTPATLKQGGSANPTNPTAPKTPKDPKTAVQLATPFPSGLLSSQVCPYCHSSGYSSPGTRCSYCRDGARWF
jgi:hypothetical protein